MKKIIVVVAFACLTNVCLAQADAKPKKFDNPKWKQVVHIDFYEGKNERAFAIIVDFEKAAKKAGTPSPEVALEMWSGTWDMLLVWSLKGGLEDLNWETSPDNIAWMKALGEIVGGEDKAKALVAEYTSLVSRTDVEWAKVH